LEEFAGSSHKKITKVFKITEVLCLLLDALLLNCNIDLFKGVYMIIIAAVDDNHGMMFNNRRISQDKVLRQKIMEIVNDKKIWMNHYSWKQFSDIDGSQINADESFLTKAIEGEYCFIENNSISQYKKNIEKIILFKWNRSYPSDFSFDFSLEKWSLINTCDFVGSSYEKITMEEYIYET